MSLGSPIWRHTRALACLPRVPKHSRYSTQSAHQRLTSEPSRSEELENKDFNDASTQNATSKESGLLVASQSSNDSSQEPYGLSVKGQSTVYNKHDTWKDSTKAKNGMRNKAGKNPQWRLPNKSFDLVVQRSENSRLRQVFRKVTNSSRQVEGKGSWSYDWTVALRMLQENTETTSQSTPQAHHPKVSRIDAMENWSAVTKILRTGVLDLDTSSSRIAYEQLSDNDILGTKEKRVARFREKISTLTIASPPSLKHSVFGANLPKLQGYQTRFRVRDALMICFKDEYRDAFSLEAFFIAIRYLAQDATMLPDARALVNIMEKSGIKATTDVFNILLQVSARRQNLSNFTSQLVTMKDMGIPADAHTWIEFLYTIESPRVKLRVIEVMKEAGMLNTGVLPKVLEPVLDYLSRECFAEGSDIDLKQWIDGLDVTYGQAWLSHRTGFKVVATALHYGRVPEALEFLEVMKDRQCDVEGSIVRAFVQVASKAENPMLALQYIELLHPQYAVSSTDVCTTLFELGWRIKSYNLCKLCWTVACSQGQATESMADKVFKSLVGNIGDVQDEKHLWSFQAGKVIVGTNFIAHSLPQNWETMNELPNRCDVVSRIAKGRPEGELRRASYKIARQVINEDLTAYGRFVYAGNFLLDLRKAIELDESWKAANLATNSGGRISSMVAQAINPHFGYRKDRPRVLVKSSGFLEARDLYQMLTAVDEGRMGQKTGQTLSEENAEPHNDVTERMTLALSEENHESGNCDSEEKGISEEKGPSGEDRARTPSAMPNDLSTYTDVEEGTNHDLESTRTGSQT